MYNNLLDNNDIHDKNNIIISSSALFHAIEVSTGWQV